MESVHNWNPDDVQLDAATAALIDWLSVTAKTLLLLHSCVCNDSHGALLMFQFRFCYTYTVM